MNEEWAKVMMKSDSINELATALSKAQHEMKGASKDTLNPFFKQKYADLAAVWDSIRMPFGKYGLSVTQITSEEDKGLFLETVLMHSSGQWLSGKIRVNPTKQDPQGMGSALSYSRRYALSAIAGVYQEDDDANLASQKQETKDDPSKRYFDPLPQEIKEKEFTIGAMKGKTFSDRLSAPGFLSWVLLEQKTKGTTKIHPELNDFLKYAREQGAIK